MKERREEKIELIAYGTLKLTHLFNVSRRQHLYSKIKISVGCAMHIFFGDFFPEKLSLKSDVHAFLSMQRFFFRCVISHKKKFILHDFQHPFYHVFAVGHTTWPNCEKTSISHSFFHSFGIKTGDTKFVFRI